MADVRVEDIAFNSPQAAGVPFEVEVEVNNMEIVAPLWGGDALCSDGVLAPDGHRVDVTLIIQSGSVEEFRETQEVCAPVQAPSQSLGGNARASFQPELPAGSYTVRAELQAQPHGSDVSDSLSLTVEEDTSSLPGGSSPGGDVGDDTIDAGDWWHGNGDDGSNPFDPTGGAVGEAKVVGGIILLIALLYAFGQGFDVDLGGGTDA